MEVFTLGQRFLQMFLANILPSAGQDVVTFKETFTLTHAHCTASELKVVLGSAMNMSKRFVPLVASLAVSGNSAT